MDTQGTGNSKCGGDNIDNLLMYTNLELSTMQVLNVKSVIDLNVCSSLQVLKNVSDDTVI